MQTVENKLKELYMQGFNDELYSKKPIDWFKNEVEKRAYFVGRADAIIGDDAPSSDYKPWEDILKEIKNL
jgi:hypothetical protein